MSEQEQQTANEGNIGQSASTGGLAGAGEVFNIVLDPFPLGRVVMPLVRVMRRGHLSWAEREEIAWAIQECLRQHKSLMDEHEYHKQASACCQSKATANVK